MNDIQGSFQRTDGAERKQQLEQRLVALLLSDPQAPGHLSHLRDHGPPGAWLAAGYVRNLVWDRLHDYRERTPLEDADVIYYDQEHPDEAEEKAWEHRLGAGCPELRWSCKNQARMHVVSGLPPYGDVADAMSCWPETATAVAAAMREDGAIAVLAPHGLEDLFGLRLRPGPRLTDAGLFLRRTRSKQWLAKWPRLQLISDKDKKEELT
ncbi:nucleotidyltransferase family protein [Paenibacillus sp. D9]|uniref:nucleotidyltransferase family protein n=1 Tax=Paenibacillus sp. D9 TaxID=665792 RepID=UPI00067664FC|nr:nucleotidyltransferase family protein [Paenibacillus sp. D9]